MSLLAQYRDSVLASAASEGWPELIVGDMGRIEGATRWTAAVELATGAELIALARALREHVAR